MPYKDPQKRKQVNRESMQKARGTQKGTRGTQEPVIPSEPQRAVKTNEPLTELPLSKKNQARGFDR